MDTQSDLNLIQAFDAFATDLEPLEATMELHPDLVEYLALAREVAFRAGWEARCASAESPDPAASTVRRRMVHTVRALADVGDRAWVQPLAIIEHMTTGEQFIDPMFPIAAARSARCCVALTVTDEGLVAAGPPDRHRLCPDVDRHRLQPLVGFEALVPG